jgi:hypothetical protein
LPELQKAAAKSGRRLFKVPTRKHGFMKRPLETLILTIRNQKVILDADLASIYGVQTKRLNEQVKRNADRFPVDFIFQLNPAEKSEVVANCDHLKRLKFSKSLPYAFTEHGAIMAATILNSPEAVKMSVFLVRAFIRMREQLAANAEFFKRLAEIDKTLLEHDEALNILWRRIQPLLSPPPAPPKPRIGFHREDKP